MSEPETIGERICAVPAGSVHTLMWMSSRAAGGQSQDAGSIDGTSLTSYHDEMLSMGQAAATMGDVGVMTTPLTTQLRLLTPIAHLIGLRVHLISIDWRAYDPTLLATGDDFGQDTPTLEAIDVSLATSSDAYAQSRFKLGEVGGWQPNFLRPIFRINGVDLYPAMGSDFASTGNLGDRSIGLPLPWCKEYRNPIDFGVLDSLFVAAGVGQIISETNLIQRYVVQCTAEVIALK